MLEAELITHCLNDLEDQYYLIKSFIFLEITAYVKSLEGTYSWGKNTFVEFYLVFGFPLNFLLFFIISAELFFLGLLQLLVNVQLTA